MTNLLRCLRPEDGNQIQGCYWRGKICTDSLDVDEKLTSLYTLNHRDPQDSYSCHYCDHDPIKSQRCFE